MIGWGGGEDLENVWGGEVMIRQCYIEIFFSINKDINFKRERKGAKTDFFSPCITGDKVKKRCFEIIKHQPTPSLVLVSGLLRESYIFLSYFLLGVYAYCRLCFNL